MNGNPVLLLLAVVTVCIFSFAEEPEVTIISPEYLEEIITGHTVDFDFVLIDVRTDSEVDAGIIASRYCKPYHMSWDFEELQENYGLLPKDMAIILYCRTGHRSLEAGHFLVQKGFTKVASLSGGYSSYKGENADVSELKPVADLPAPSYLGDTTTVTIAVPGRHHTVITTDKTGFKGRFTLQGRALSTGVHQRSAPVYILECIGERANGSIRNMRLRNSGK